MVTCYLFPYLKIIFPDDNRSVNFFIDSFTMKYNKKLKLTWELDRCRTIITLGFSCIRKPWLSGKILLGPQLLKGPYLVSAIFDAIKINDIAW